MFRLLLLASFFTLFSTQINAQKHHKYLSGYWKGYITQGSLEATVGLDFEMYLEVKGKVIKGRTYVHQKDGSIIEMSVSGYLYSDNSIYLEEEAFIPAEGSEAKPTHTKKYQFIYKRSIFESENSLDGYWQEIIQTPMSLKRRRGKIVMQKITNSKA